MKKLLRFNLFILFALFTTISVNATPTPCLDPEDCNTEGGTEGQGDGTRRAPIDDYAPLLVITAITIAGVISYKQRQVIKK